MAKSILIFDDDAEALQILCDLVATNSVYQVYPAGNLEQLNLIFSQVRIDLVVTDLVTPEIMGFDLIRALRESLPNLPAVVVTGYDQPHWRSQDVPQGVVVIEKPLDHERLHEVIASALLARFDVAQVGALSGGAEKSPGKYSEPGKTGTGKLTKVLRQQEEEEKRGFTGQIDQFQLVDIIQMCCLSNRTGKMIISRGQQSGNIWLKGGTITHAVCGIFEGERAVYEIISWDYGGFKLEENATTQQKTVNSGWEHLVMEGVRLRDERGEGAVAQKSSDDLVGQTVGPFQVLRKIAKGRWGNSYEAIQTTVNRRVVLKILSKENEEPSLIQAFLARAAAMAKLSHPNITSVFEAGELNGLYYYAREYLSGPTLKELIVSGKPVDDLTVLKLITEISNALVYLHRGQIPHEEITPENILLDKTGSVKLCNPAITGADESNGPQYEINKLGQALNKAQQNTTSQIPQLQMMIARMILVNEGGYSSLAALQQDARVVEEIMKPRTVFTLSQQDQRGLDLVSDEKRRVKRNLFMGGIVSAVLLILVIAAFIIIRPGKAPAQAVVNKMIKVPEGEFIYQNGTTKSLPTFYIDEFEVTIGDYLKFMEATKGKYTESYEAPTLTDKNKNHTPKDWEVIKLCIKEQKNFKGQKINWDHPIFNLDWYDAYAYAKWAGKRLPTEEEWEKAARGNSGNTYPWGSTFEPRSANLGLDSAMAVQTGIGGMDGFAQTSPVNFIKGDVSPFGIKGMAGNVAEWTSSFDSSRVISSVKVPIVRGGHWKSVEIPMTYRDNANGENERTDYIGFRCASDTPPADK